MTRQAEIPHGLSDRQERLFAAVQTWCKSKVQGPPSAGRETAPLFAFDIYGEPDNGRSKRE